MDGHAQSPLYGELEAAFGWWREAGVDCDFTDEPADWLAARPEPADPAPKQASPKAQQARAAPAAAQPRMVVDPATLPDDLAGFIQWWMTEPALDAGRTSGRVAPRGACGAELMMLIPEPEREDGDTLLSGPQGRLLANFLEAVGCAPDQAYFASAIPRHLPGADWTEIAASGIGAAVRRHVALARPRRVIALGGNILPLIGNDLPQEAAVLREINLEGQSIPLLAARDLGALLERPRWKAALWKHWLDWSSRTATG